MAEKNYKVRAAHCNWRASEEEIYRTLRRITDPLHRSWEKLEKADRIVIKFNMMKLLNRIFTTWDGGASWSMTWSHALFCVCCESEPVRKLLRRIPIPIRANI